MPPVHAVSLLHAFPIVDGNLCVKELLPKVTSVTPYRVIDNDAEIS